MLEGAPQRLTGYPFAWPRSIELTMALKSLFSWAESAFGGNEAVPMIVTPSVDRTETSENGRHRRRALAIAP